MQASGDCTLIQTPSGKNILIDTGEAENTVVEYLLDRGITKIDYLMISHFDSDHSGKTIEIMENLNVKRLIISKQPEYSEQFENTIKSSNKYKVEIIQVKAGDCIKIEDDIYFEILWPKTEEMITENPLNNNSIVCKLNYNNFTMMFTGDIEEIAENKIVAEYNLEELNSTILKVAHHGSATSSTEKFINKVNSKIALIGVGKDNKFEHPHDKIIKTLEFKRVNIFRTDLHGEIVLKVDKNGKIKVKTHL